MNALKEQELIARCLLQIEEKLGWGSSSGWHSDVFSELSEAIQQETKVLLSPTTLKRVWGKINYKSSPSISTLNTLSQFIGFENWRAFKNNQAQNKTLKKPLVNMSVVFSLAAGIALLFITLFSTIGTDEHGLTTEDISKIKFSSRTVTNAMPNSVIFDFDISNIKSDSVYIQQYWDANKTIKINTKQKQATGIYYFPGYFRAKLVIDGTVVKQHDLFIKSNGWSASIDYDPIPKYVEPKNFINDGLLLDDALISEIQHSDTPLISSFHFIEDLGTISADNFSLETTLKNIYRDKWAVCQMTYIYIIGTKGVIIIPFTIPGCVSNINVMLNDVYYKGKEHDLSTFGIDLSSPKNIKINVTEQQLRVFVEDEQIFSGTYTKPVGKLVGIRYKFVGAGLIKHTKIIDSNGNTIMDNNFSTDYKQHLDH